MTVFFSVENTGLEQADVDQLNQAHAHILRVFEIPYPYPSGDVLAANYVEHHAAQVLERWKKGRRGEGLLDDRPGL